MAIYTLKKTQIQIVFSKMSNTYFQIYNKYLKFKNTFEKHIYQLLKIFSN